MLITLGIIGIIAAMTMTALISKYQKKVVVTRLKAAYSQINQALVMAQSQYGDTENWERDANKILLEYIAPNLNSSSFTNDIEHDYQHTMCNNSQTYKFLTGQGMGVPFNSVSPSIKLVNGSCIALNRFDPDFDGMDQTKVFIDVNGPNPPNINGKDLFVFEFDVQNGKILPSYYSAKYNLMTPTQQGNCNKQAVYGGSACARVIMEAGWDMPKNYPW